MPGPRRADGKCILLACHAVVLFLPAGVEAASCLGPKPKCEGGQTASCHMHAGCEENTCRSPQALCMSLLVSWQCTCKENELYDTERSLCVAATDEACVKQSQVSATSLDALLPENLEAELPAFPPSPAARGIGSAIERQHLLAGVAVGAMSALLVGYMSLHRSGRRREPYLELGI
eukprot:gnl/TRDRNA2_/TRDRNA2_192763_c0_seq1.p2 gnl/TRDRNA2_/TRDRNA2_192763_c0~~gnl/TRDRNA2_/TRDRNA2_192763_c0_seq1.p2  ORF type:complete len:203 (+),score=26.70 gnl/TRDRNA2_/TRDRNA2_192763_c0_seq1:84-611(+)